MPHPRHQPRSEVLADDGAHRPGQREGDAEGHHCHTVDHRHGCRHVGAEACRSSQHVACHHRRGQVRQRDGNGHGQQRLHVCLAVLGAEQCLPAPAHVAEQPPVMMPQLEQTHQERGDKGRQRCHPGTGQPHAEPEDEEGIQHRVDNGRGQRQRHGFCRHAVAAQRQAEHQGARLQRKTQPDDAQVCCAQLLRAPLCAQHGENGFGRHPCGKQEHEAHAHADAQRRGRNAAGALHIALPGMNGHPRPGGNGQPQRQRKVEEAHRARQAQGCRGVHVAELRDEPQVGEVHQEQGHEPDGAHDGVAHHMPRYGTAGEGRHVLGVPGGCCIGAGHGGCLCPCAPACQATFARIWPHLPGTQDAPGAARVRFALAPRAG